MPRIRSIKPEFWANEGLSELPEATHMLAAALINYADDEGYFNANPALVKAGCFPLREPTVPIADSLKQLESIDFLRFCIGSDGRTYGRIVCFEKHQRVSHPSPSKIKSLAEFTEASGNTPEPSGTNGERGTGIETELKGTGNGRTVAYGCVSEDSAFTSLTENDLLDTGRLLEWHQVQAERRSPLVPLNVDGRQFVVAAAEQALSGKTARNRVAVFSGIIRGKQHATTAAENCANRRLRDFDQQSAGPSQFAAPVAKSLTQQAR